MIRIELPVLVERLNPICRHMLEEAAALCVNHQGAEIRIEHLLLDLAIRSAPDRELQATSRAFHEQEGLHHFDRAGGQQGHAHLGQLRERRLELPRQRRVGGLAAIEAFKQGVE